MTTLINAEIGFAYSKNSGAAINIKLTSPTWVNSVSRLFHYTSEAATVRAAEVLALRCALASAVSAVYTQADFELIIRFNNYHAMLGWMMMERWETQKWRSRPEGNGRAIQQKEHWKEVLRLKRRFARVTLTGDGVGEDVKKAARAALSESIKAV